MTLRNLEFYVKIKCFRTVSYYNELVHGCASVRVFRALQERAELWESVFFVLVEKC